MARKDNKLDQLSRVPLFSALNKKELQTLGRASDEIKVPAGKVLCEEGTAGHEFYLILDGTASVLRGKKKVATLGSGKYFGEMALLDRGPRTASVKAEEDLEVLVLGQREFSGVLDEIPGLAHKLLAHMAARLRESDAKAYSH
ncbi:MAG TPA: cyclic nucleotide-binding domain-containing protein [Acidimicrobiales bacterium]|nr:cyclic nucleotide-binding domain-containing protein [Acidimicrobiales bacterium]